MRAGFLRGARQTTLDVLRGFTTNPDWIGLVTAQWGNFGLPPAQSSFGIHAVVAALISRAPVTPWEGRGASL